jgi:enolase
VFNTIFNFRNQLIESLKKKNVSLSFGNFGGFAPNFSKNIDPIEIIIEAASNINFINGVNYYLGIDFSANNFYRNKNYYLKDQPNFLSERKYFELILNIIKNYHILLVEDIFANADLNNWHDFFKNFTNEIYITGDDLIGGSKNRLQKAIKDKLINSINIKPSQIGTITETLEVINLAKKNNINLIIGSRNGETNDDMIVDLGVGIQANFVKFGALNRGERVEKYNRLWEIEKKIVTS